MEAPASCTNLLAKLWQGCARRAHPFTLPSCERVWRMSYRFEPAVTLQPNSGRLVLHKADPSPENRVVQFSAAQLQLPAQPPRRT